MIHRRTCALSYQIKGHPNVNWLFSWNLFSKPILASFTVMGPLIWYDSAQVRLWIILNINNKHYYHLGKSQICAGAGDYFRFSKLHSEKLWPAISVKILPRGTRKERHIFGVFVSSSDVSWDPRPICPQRAVCRQRCHPGLCIVSGWGVEVEGAAQWDQRPGAHKITNWWPKLLWGQMFLPIKRNPDMPGNFLTPFSL